MEIFEIQIREVMDCWEIRSGYPFGRGMIEETQPTKLEALQLMERLIHSEVRNERKNLINIDMCPIPEWDSGSTHCANSPGGTD